MVEFKPWIKRGLDTAESVCMEKFTGFDNAAFSGAVVADKRRQWPKRNCASVFNRLEVADFDG
jgi:hypothetical protein